MYVATMPARVARYRGASGLGDAATAARNVQVGGSIAAGAAVAAISSAGSVLGVAAATLVPIVGPALAAATMLVQHLVANSGCGQTCIITSEWANQAAAALQQMKDAYFALPAPRTEGQKAVAIAAYNDIWNQLRQTCGQPGTGDAGVRCITDRQAGACVWRQKYAPVHPGDPEIGECWNWDNGYLGAIRQDPVVPDTLASQVSGTLDSVFGGAGLGTVNLIPLLVISGLVLLAVKA